MSQYRKLSADLPIILILRKPAFYFNTELFIGENVQQLNLQKPTTRLVDSISCVNIVIPKLLAKISTNVCGSTCCCWMCKHKTAWSMNFYYKGENLICTNNLYTEGSCTHIFMRMHKILNSSQRMRFYTLVLVIDWYISIHTFLNVMLNHFNIKMLIYAFHSVPFPILYAQYCN